MQCTIDSVYTKHSQMKVRHILHDSKNISYKCLYIHELQTQNSLYNMYTKY